MFKRSELRNSAPFRVGIHHHAGAFVLKLEGAFGDADAPEVEARWRTAASLLASRAFEVDLAGVTSVDPGARALLIRMRESGAELLEAPTPGPACASWRGLWRTFASRRKGRSRPAAAACPAPLPPRIHLPHRI